MNRLSAACILGLCVLVGASPAALAAQRELPALAPAPRDALTHALESGRLNEARYALERARTLFELGDVRAEFGRVSAPSPHAATLILRDLALRRELLRGTERAEAAALFRRPRGPDRFCDDDRPLCFHRVKGGSRHATSNANFAATIATFQAVWDLEVEQYGYAPPLPDAGRGGSAATDIYLRDLGGNKNPLFGYCTTDDPDAGFSSFSDVWAYCVVDDDFSQRQFGSSQEPQEFRDVTAAHEFFHAIQFHYDVREDLWLMEGTAMLMEGQFRPEVDDRMRYLADSVLRSPRTPVDYGADGFEYGAWIYWRFLVERFAELADPLVIREVWERAAGASEDMDGPGPDTIASDPYSLAATRAVLASRGTGFGPLFAEFTRVNRAPAAFYDEGDRYPQAAAVRLWRLRPDETTGRRSTRLRHLASASYVFKRSGSVAPDAKLRIVVDLPRLEYGAAVGVLLRRTNGDVQAVGIPLDEQGDGAKGIDFGTSVRRLDLVLTNASTRMRCWQGTPHSCTGTGRDDLRTYAYRATVR